MKAKEVLLAYPWLLVPIVFLALILAWIFNPIVIVGAGDRGIVLNFGAVGEVWGEGIHFKVPFYQNVAFMSVRTQKVEADATAASKDLQDVFTKIAVNFHLDPSKVNTIYQNIGFDYSNKVIAPAIQEAVKASTSKYNAEELITKREQVKDDTIVLLRERLTEYNIVVETVSITDFKFGKEFTQAIEQKVVSQQNKLNAEYVLQIREVEAKQRLAQAQGEANAKIAIAEADAKAIQMVSLQLKDNPQYLEFQAISKWDGKLPAVTSGAVPLISLPEGTIASSKWPA